MIKTDLGYMTVNDAVAVRLEQYRDAAIQMLIGHGIPLNSAAGYSMQDAQLISMYACYLHNKRNSNEPMTRALQFAIHCRLCELAMNGGGV